jgi:hypothetical protein
MIVAQADPGWDLSDQTRAPLRDPKTLVESDSNPDGFHDFLSALRERVIEFRRPVAYVHGDSHYFRIDKPSSIRQVGDDSGIGNCSERAGVSRILNITSRAPQLEYSVAPTLQQSCTT